MSGKHTVTNQDEVKHFELFEEIKMSHDDDSSPEFLNAEDCELERVQSMRMQPDD